MALNQEQLDSFINESLNRIQLAIIRANATGELNNLAEKYGLSDLLGEAIPSFEYFDKFRAKILVLAFQFHDVDDWKVRAKKAFGIQANRIEFVEYKANFNYAKLRCSSAYSDIFVGPIPHKGVGIGDASSFLADAENHPEDYPKIHRMTDSGGDLKATLSSFMKCLQNSNFVKECTAC